jgi:hypothetical protein
MKLLYVILIVVGVLLVGAGVALGIYFALRQKPAPDEEETPPKTGETAAKTIRSHHPKASVSSTVFQAEPAQRSRAFTAPEEVEEEEEEEVVAPTLGLSTTEYKVVGYDEPSRQYVYRPRQKTLFMAGVTRFVMPFHGIKFGPLVLGSLHVHAVQDKPDYTYDSHRPQLLLPQVELEEPWTNNVKLECSARYYEYYFKVGALAARMMINLSHRGEFGDVLLYNDETRVYEWYDKETKTFVTRRTEHVVTVVPGDSPIKTLSKTHAVFVPINVLNQPYDVGNDVRCAEIDFIPETAVAFVRAPPAEGASRAWIMENVYYTAMTSAIDAVVTLVK